jgi:hypothetical protein
MTRKRNEGGNEKRAISPDLEKSVVKHTDLILEGKKKEES